MSVCVDVCAVTVTAFLLVLNTINTPEKPQSGDQSFGYWFPTTFRPRHAVSGVRNTGTNAVITPKRAYPACTCLYATPRTEYGANLG